MTSNYEKLVKYLNEPNKKNKPPLGVEGDLFDRFVRCYSIWLDGPWEQCHPYDEKIISAGSLTVDFRENIISYNIEASPGVMIQINYTPDEEKTDEEFITDFNRLFGDEVLERAFDLFSGAKK